MRRTGTRRVWVGTAAAVWLAVAAGRAGAVPAASVDLDALMAEKDYPAVVAGASKLLSASGPAAAGVDKGHLYAVKGEAQLQLKRYPEAADAFARAAKASTNDPGAAAVDTATALLIKRSHAGAYVPRQAGADGTKPSPVDVVSAADRKTALGYLFADEFAAAASKLKTAKAATTVPQLMTAADTVNGLRQLELAATGTDEKSRPEVTAVASHAHDLLSSALQAMAKRVEDIKTAASSPPASASYGMAGRRGGATGKAGLTSSNKSELQGIITNAQKVGQAADTLSKAMAAPKVASATQPAGSDDPAAATSSEGGGSGSDLAGVKTEADKVAADAKEVLNATYGRRTGNGYGNTGGTTGTNGPGGNGPGTTGGPPGQPPRPR